jgi:uncharacterized membrane protein
MWLLIILLEFFFFAFIGFIIDTSFRTYENKKITKNNYFKDLPICPIYGFGALMLIFYFKYYSFVDVRISFVLMTLLLIFFELVSAIFCKHVLKIVLWDYSNKKYNYQGYIDLLHSCCWFILVLVFYYLVFPYIIIMEEYINCL